MAADTPVVAAGTVVAAVAVRNPVVDTPAHSAVVDRKTAAHSPVSAVEHNRTVRFEGVAAGPSRGAAGAVRAFAPSLPARTRVGRPRVEAQELRSQHTRSRLQVSEPHIVDKNSSLSSCRFEATRRDAGRAVKGTWSRSVYPKTFRYGIKGGRHRRPPSFIIHLTQKNGDFYKSLTRILDFMNNRLSPRNRGRLCTCRCGRAACRNSSCTRIRRKGAHRSCSPHGRFRG